MTNKLKLCDARVKTNEILSMTVYGNVAYLSLQALTTWLRKRYHTDHEANIHQIPARIE